MALEIPPNLFQSLAGDCKYTRIGVPGLRFLPECSFQIRHSVIRLGNVTTQIRKDRIKIIRSRPPAGYW